MEIGFIGLGRMGLNMVRRLTRDGHRLLATARTDAKRLDAEEAGAQWVVQVDDFATRLAPPPIVWVMVPAGDATEETIAALSRSLPAGSLIIDGGNSDYRDSRRRAERLSQRGLGFIDAGTSGGIWGLEKGYCIMAGGEPDLIARASPLLTSLAPPNGWARVGPAGSGHFVKMVHNAIEYGMMQAYAEGFELLRQSSDHLDLHAIANLWMQGSVVRSWLLELAADVFAEDPNLETLTGQVADSGECRWAVETAIQQGSPVPVMAAALFSRFSSRQDNAFSHRFLAALRKKFGGHPVVKK